MWYYCLNITNKTIPTTAPLAAKTRTLRETPQQATRAKLVRRVLSQLEVTVRILNPFSWLLGPLVTPYKNTVLEAAWYSLRCSWRAKQHTPSPCFSWIRRWTWPF